MKLQDKTIVITGASKGLGRAMAIHCSQRQANVILTARSENLLALVRDEIKELTGKTPLVIKGDIAEEDDVAHLASILREKDLQVDVLINNAGFGTYRKSEGISNQEMRAHFAVNFFGAYYCIKALLPSLKQSDSGYILNIGSLFSKVALADNSVYAASKFALAGFSEGLRQELKPFGIGVGLFLPGSMKTPFQDDKESKTLRPPEWMMQDPEKIVLTLEKMICRQQKQVIKPRWMLLGLKLKSG